jgi:plasmid stability protein
MGDMSIRIEDELRTKIEDLARINGRSLEDEIATLLRKAVQIERPETAYEAAVRISAMTPKGVKQTDSLTLLREDRDR